MSSEISQSQKTNPARFHVYEVFEQQSGPSKQTMMAARAGGGERGGCSAGVSRFADEEGSEIRCTARCRQLMLLYCAFKGG